MITFYPIDVPQRLEFDKVQTMLIDQSLGLCAAERLDQLTFLTDAAEIERLLKEVAELKQAIERGESLPLRGYADLRNDLKMLELDGYVLSLDSFRALLNLLQICRDLSRFFKTRKDVDLIFPILSKIVTEAQFDETILTDLEKVFDKEGNVRADASPELMRLRRLQGSKRKELDSVFRRILQNYASKNLLSDNLETFRNGRRVLSVPAEFKRQVRGIIHDESATGKTSFVEPEEVIDINNDLLELENEEKREIYKILSDLCQKLRPANNWLKGYLELIVRFDIIQAKAHLACKIGADMPEQIFDEPHFGWESAYHPILFYSNLKAGKRTIPFDFHLKGENRFLLLSGPNAGGKSVCMKTVGLAQLMLQAGLLVPCAEGTKMGIFKKIIADIGDQQSIEDDLSTYSSRLKNASLMLQNADKSTLVLIDELGAGTDPKAGGAIAEALLVQLLQRQAWGVVTTHFSVLKLFAFKNKGILNGAMIFDKDNLSPTYQMKIGKPGSSYAFEIAGKSGLPEHMLNFAKKRMGEAEKNLDDLLIDLQREKQEFEEAKGKLEKTQKSLDKLINNYENQSKELEVGRKRLRLQMKEIELIDRKNNRQEINKIIKEIRDTQNSEQATEKARELLQQQVQQQKNIEKELENLENQIIEKQAQTNQKNNRAPEFAPGVEVKLTDSGVIGVIESINKNQAVVVTNTFKINVKLHNLQALVDTVTKPQVITVKTNREPSVHHSNETKLDIRGMRLDDAMKSVERFIDNAVILGVNVIEIVHGKGTGALRQVVVKCVKAYNGARLHHPEDNQGGDGVSIIELW